MHAYRFTFAVVVVATLAMLFPEHFTRVGAFELKRLILPLLQVIMFGMGTTMSGRDFAGVAQTPGRVVVGLVCQFTIMPLLGFALSRSFNFPAEVAAGVVLIGCSPSGLASNVMAYIARANVALSVTITSCATLLAPVMTPALMKLLAGQLIEVHFVRMMLEIMQIVILPIIAGVVVNHVFRRQSAWLQRWMPVVSMAGIISCIGIITAAGRESLLTIGPALVACTLIHNLGGFVLGYWSARLCRLPAADCRTVAIEVGLQNGGLASGIALQMGKVATVGLAPALFGPLMNISGSMLASYWSRRLPDDGASAPHPPA